MEVANSSLLDEGSAAAEAMAMIARTVNSKAKNQFFISDRVHPQTIDLMQLRAKYFGIDIIVGELCFARTCRTDSLSPTHANTHTHTHAGSSA